MVSSVGGCGCCVGLGDRLTNIIIRHRNITPFVTDSFPFITLVNLVSILYHFLLIDV